MTDRQFHVGGDLVPADAATVHVRDRGFMYGDAAFETLRIYGGEPFEWRAHVDRLRRTCETLGFGDAVPPDADLRERVAATVAANDLPDATVKLSITRGVQDGKLTPSEPVDPTVVVTISPLPRGGIDGERVWSEPASVTVVDRRRAGADALPADAKTHNYLGGILARLELRETDHDEAILRSPGGFLAEGATSNLFFVVDGRLFTPTADLPLLLGITRGVALSLADDAGIPIQTGRYAPGALDRADEAFLTNSTWEIRPVTHIDGRSLDVGPVTRELQARFDDRVEALYET